MAVNKRTGDKPVRLERDVRSSRREADNTDRVRLAYFIQNTKPSFRGKCAFCDKKKEKRGGKKGRTEGLKKKRKKEEQRAAEYDQIERWEKISKKNIRSC